MISSFLVLAQKSLISLLAFLEKRVNFEQHFYFVFSSTVVELTEQHSQLFENIISN